MARTKYFVRVAGKWYPCAIAERNHTIPRQDRDPGVLEFCGRSLRAETAAALQPFLEHFET